MLYNLKKISRWTSEDECQDRVDNYNDYGPGSHIMCYRCGNPATCPDPNNLDTPRWSGLTCSTVWDACPTDGEGIFFVVSSLIARLKKTTTPNFHPTCRH